MTAGQVMSSGVMSSGVTGVPHRYGAQPAILPPRPGPVPGGPVPGGPVPGGSVPGGPALPAEVRVGLYRRLQELRQLEKRAYDLFLQQLVKGTSHLSLGMEAISAGFGAAMAATDYTFATYRGHAHTLSRGVPMAAVLAELLGRSNGLMGGKGGSMHLTSVEHGVMGSYAIIGAHLCIANGAAWSAQLRGSGQVAVCFFGDGTTNIGAFHEALNYAAVYKLPTVFVCENNLYMEYTAIADVTSVARPAADRAPAYGLAPITVDGNDVEACYATARQVLGQARGGGGPALVEATTYRHGGHSRADPGAYRPAAEIEAWKAHDPVQVARTRLIADGAASEQALARIDQEVARAVDEATEAAKNGAQPAVESAFRDVWADGGWSWRN
jgi:acetoin:2,6-dichlorophenolindophenol oxidoreductase subunit alpha